MKNVDIKTVTEVIQGSALTAVVCLHVGESDDEIQITEIVIGKPELWNKLDTESIQHLLRLALHTAADNDTLANGELINLIVEEPPPPEPISRN